MITRPEQEVQVKVLQTIQVKLKVLLSGRLTSQMIIRTDMTNLTVGVQTMIARHLS